VGSSTQPCARIDDDAHLILSPSWSMSSPKLCFKGSFGLHRAADIDEEDEIARRALVLGHLAALSPMRTSGARAQGTPPLHRRGEGRIAFWLRIVVAEVVDNSSMRSAPSGVAVIEETPHDRVARGVHIDAEVSSGFPDARKSFSVVAS
jgi:hypothetical protein